jgi:hypothetical protein
VTTPAEHNPARLRALADRFHSWEGALSDEDREVAATLRDFARVRVAMPSAQRLRDIAERIDFFEAWLARTLAKTTGKVVPSSGMQHDLRALADAVEAIPTCDGDPCRCGHLERHRADAVEGGGE